MRTTSSIIVLAGSVLWLALAGCARKPRNGSAGGNTENVAASLAERPAQQTSALVAQRPPEQPTGLAADTHPVRRGMSGGRGMMGGMMGRGVDTAAAPTVSATAAAPACPDVTPALVDLGRRVFSGAGNCHVCHGSDAHGSALAPNLADSTWLNIDGSYAAIADLVRSGVPHPKKFPAPMPPMGGGQLSTEQICAVAAYVHGLGGGR